jgi:hypothetical protein
MIYIIKMSCTDGGGDMRKWLAPASLMGSHGQGVGVAHGRRCYAEAWVDRSD